MRTVESHRSTLRARDEKGSLVFELSAFAFLFLVFALLSVHTSVMLYGAFFNDRACRDAARAAADATTADQATTYAKAILKSHGAAGSYLSQPVLQPIVWTDYAGSPPAQTSPSVTVTTSTTATLPFRPLSFLGKGTVLADGTVVFTQSYTFPLIKLKAGT
jgi:hypothetical protein